MKNFTILSINTIKRAFETLNICGKKCLIVTNNKNQMLGTLTDGDIRKAILKGFIIRRKDELKGSDD